jgi:hypothetical protein
MLAVELIANAMPPAQTSGDGPHDGISCTAPANSEPGAIFGLAVGK